MRAAYILGALGPILTYFGLSAIPATALAIYYKETHAVTAFIAVGLLSVITGQILHTISGKHQDFELLKKREALFAVALTWLTVSLIGSIPYLLNKHTFVDAIFESTAAITACGATIISDISFTPKSLLLWRAMIQWIGGAGIILIFTAIFPQFSVAGRQMFSAETPGPKESSFTPKLKDSAHGLWKIYLLLTIASFIALCIAGMPVFDAICNAFSTISAGGYSPHPQSIMGYKSDKIKIVTIVIMFLSGTNFMLQYKAVFTGKIDAILKNSEFRWYCGIIIILSTLLSIVLMNSNGYTNLYKSFLDSVYQVVSILTSTGSISVNYNDWNANAKSFLFIAMFIGGSAGSAGGGIKIVRLIYLYKYIKNEIFLILHPQSTTLVKIDNTTISKDTGRQIISFILFYILLFCIVAFTVTILENNAVTGISGTAGTLGNTGMGFGKVGPISDFSHLQPISKILFIITMIMGRLEIIPILAMLNPDFWRKHKYRKI